MTDYHSPSQYIPSPSSASGSVSSGTAIAGPADGAPPYKLTNPGDVSSAVKNLLMSTKRLQEVLKLWSVDQATEGDVSDVYVQIGHEFNVTISAFAYHQIELSDIHSVPAELRNVLERYLGEDPSPAILEECMPELRKVLFKLLKGLQNRQDRWHAVAQRLSSDSMVSLHSSQLR
ncbi:hypothetical protein CPB84DRAFT_1789548 [Gymnopilus junonius]|uniref:Aip3p/Bud6 N-terminal domain-containing protein n=1 Tax=Gymnopilus junonius TaxID=109634 RepID=A0A9P5NDM2_GYMJU|nr:hypothetical protein CPB84DRAFT_1789548 [Gymnopilus junonius]